MDINKPKIVKVNAKEISQVFQTKKEFMDILDDQGNLFHYFSLFNRYLDYYLPPKRDLNFEFLKKWLKKEKKVRSFNKQLPESFTLIVIKELQVVKA